MYIHTICNFLRKQSKNMVETSKDLCTAHCISGSILLPLGQFLNYYLFTPVYWGGGHPSKIASAAPTEGPPIPVWEILDLQVRRCCYNGHIVRICKYDRNDISSVESRISWKYFWNAIFIHNYDYPQAVRIEFALEIKFSLIFVGY